MGRQIEFQMSEKTQNEFIEFLKQNNYIFLDSNKNTVKELGSEKVFYCYLYKTNYESITMKKVDNQIIDDSRSYVIHFKKTSVDYKSKKVYSGRIWIGTYFYDENGNTIMKSNGFIKDYEKLVRWIKKNVPCRSRKIGKYVYKLYISDEILELEASGFSL